MSEACLKCRLRSENTLNCMLMAMIRYSHYIISIHFLRQTGTKEPIEKGEFLRTNLKGTMPRQDEVFSDTCRRKYSYILLINMCVLYSIQQCILPIYMCTVYYAGLHIAYVYVCTV
jgi:hypothetical protein